MTPDNPLEEALIAASSRPEARPTFYRLMLESSLFLIYDGPARNGEMVFGEDAQLQLQLIDIDGVKPVPVFYRGAEELFGPIKPFYRRKLFGLF